MLYVKDFSPYNFGKNLGLKWRRINAGNNLIDSTSTARETYQLSTIKKPFFENPSI